MTTVTVTTANQVQVESSDDDSLVIGRFIDPAKVKRDLIKMLQATIKHVRTMEINEPATIGTIARGLKWIVLDNEAIEIHPQDCQDEIEYLDQMTSWNKCQNFDESSCGDGWGNSELWNAMGISEVEFERLEKQETEKLTDASKKLRDFSDEQWKEHFTNQHEAVA